ncbi:MAG: FeoB-associated Cys-rich membrane protein [Candidatus Methanomethylophilaceae archaeon]
MLNAATAIVSICVAVILILAAYSMIRDKRKGGCIGCCKNGQCKHKEPEEKEY